jgi:hypothetical protein
MDDTKSPGEIIRDACPRAKVGLMTMLVKDCEWCTAAEKAVEVAIQEERERCAKIAEPVDAVLASVIRKSTER